MSCSEAGCAVCSCFRFFCRQRHRWRHRYDDSLDVFGVHGIGGMTGILLTGIFATAAIGGSSGLLEGEPRLLLVQLTALPLRSVGRPS